MRASTRQRYRAGRRAPPTGGRSRLRLTAGHDLAITLTGMPTLAKSYVQLATVEGLPDTAVRRGEDRTSCELVKGDAADERQRPWEPLAERRRPPARDLRVDVIVARRRRRGGLPGRDRDRPHDLVVVDQQRDLAVEQDLGAPARTAAADRSRMRRGREPRLRRRVQQARAAEPLPFLEREDRVLGRRPEPAVGVALDQVAEVDQALAGGLHRSVGRREPELRRLRHGHVRRLEEVERDRAAQRHAGEPGRDDPPFIRS